MDNEQKNIDMLEFPYFYNKEGEVPFWDHPLLSGHKVLPDKYRPHTSIEAALSLYQRHVIDDDDLVILKVLGDSICANEDQLRRYMSAKLSRSQVSKRLDRMRRFGLVDRWKVRLKDDLEEVNKPPAPFTLGIAGFKLMKHFYNDHFFMDHNKWDYLGIGGLQRYVAMNELRCQFVEVKSISQWKWTPLIANNRLVPKPMAAAELRTPKGNINLLIDRPQMNQNFMGYLKDKIRRWKSVYENHGKLQVESLPLQQTVHIIFASTLSMAKKIHSKLLLDTFPFVIWVCVEEDLLSEGLSTSFYKPEGEELKRLKLGFLDAKVEQGV